MWADPSQTPAQRVRAGYAAIRRGAGEETLLLGCGVPLANVVGLVDACRIGPDVARSHAADDSDGARSGGGCYVGARRRHLGRELPRVGRHDTARPGCRALFDEGVSISRAADAAARAGRPARAEDLLERDPATRFSGAEDLLVTDPSTGRSSFSPG